MFSVVLHQTVNVSVQVCSSLLFSFASANVCLHLCDYVAFKGSRADQVLTLLLTHSMTVRDVDRTLITRVLATR